MRPRNEDYTQQISRLADIVQLERRRARERMGLLRAKAVDGTLAASGAPYWLLEARRHLDVIAAPRPPAFRAQSGAGPFPIQRPRAAPALRLVAGPALSLVEGLALSLVEG